MSRKQKLLPNHYYHIYNRGIDGTPLFREDRNYDHFLWLYIKYIVPVAATYAYCLMNNHFHLLIRILTNDEQHERSQTSDVYKPLDPTEQFRRFFISYSKAFNKAYGRTGSLFEHRFKRKTVYSDAYFSRLVTYIHQNPQRHGFVDDFREWKYSSWRATLQTDNTHVERSAVLDWFGGEAEFISSHETTFDDVDLNGLYGTELN